MCPPGSAFLAAVAASQFGEAPVVSLHNRWVLVQQIWGNHLSVVMQGCSVPYSKPLQEVRAPEAEHVIPEQAEQQSHLAFVPMQPVADCK